MVAQRLAERGGLEALEPLLLLAAGAGEQVHDAVVALLLVDQLEPAVHLGGWGCHGNPTATTTVLDIRLGSQVSEGDHDGVLLAPDALLDESGRQEEHAAARQLEVALVDEGRVRDDLVPHGALGHVHFGPLQAQVRSLEAHVHGVGLTDVVVVRVVVHQLIHPALKHNIDVISDRCDMIYICYVIYMIFIT